MKKDFLEYIRPLMDMFFYNDSEDLRFLAWIRAKGNPGVSNMFLYEVKKVEKKWKEWNETDFNNIKEL